MDGCIAPDHRVCVTLRHSCHTPPSSSKSGKLSSVNGIGGASNGILFWDGNHWASTISPDGVYRWNGAAWTVIAPDDPIRTIALDDRSQFEGLSPSPVQGPIATPVQGQWTLNRFRLDSLAGACSLEARGGR